MKVQVESYAGRIGYERPARFRLSDHEYVVQEVLDQWYGPQHVYFKVKAEDGNLYILRHETAVPEGRWDLVAFRIPASTSPELGT